MPDVSRDIPLGTVFDRAVSPPFAVVAGRNPGTFRLIEAASGGKRVDGEWCEFEDGVAEIEAAVAEEAKRRWTGQRPRRIDKRRERLDT